MTFYKATRPDGFDFFTGTVDYAGICGTGERLPEKSPPLSGLDPSTATNQVYHASEEPHRALIGGGWPCRLFEIDGEVVARSPRGTKLGFYTMTVVREIEAHRVLGPNGEAVAEMIDRAQKLTHSEFTRMANFVHVFPYPYREQLIVQRTTATYGYHSVLGAVRRAVLMDNEKLRFPGIRGTVQAVDGDRALMDAFYVVILRHLIDERTFDALYRPWVEVMGS